jgi:UDP-N-acetyl-D-glucosamine dehydrogenase
MSTPPTSHANALIAKLDDRSAVIGIVGMGYVGLPLALAYADAGFRVLGFDVDDEKVARLNSGESYIEHIANERVRALLAQGFEATVDMTRATEPDALVLCVPTPLNRYREPDLTFVTGTMDTLAPHMRPGQIVSLESTSYPGTTEEELLPRIVARGLEVGRDAFLVYSPEREDPGNGVYDTQSIPKVLGGHTATCLEVGKALYAPAIDTIVPVSSTRAAEMTKLLENIHRAVNIGLVNELKIVADRMGIDIYEVIDAAATKPFGFTPYYPGPGIGGHCIPVDPFYLTWKAREYGLHTRFIELAGEINRSMPEYVVGKVTEALNDTGRSLKGSRILILGIAYKKNVDDMRESPAVDIMELLDARGAMLAYSDPHVPVFPRMRHHRFDLQSVDVTPDKLGDYDAVVLATDHDAFDYDLIARHARLIIDSRGRYRSPMDKVVNA